MTISELKDRLTNLTGETNEERLSIVFDLAIKMVWQYTDLPGTLLAITLEVAQNEAMVTLPPEVYAIRGVRTARGNNIQLNTAAIYYQRPWSMSNQINWRLLKADPLHSVLKAGGRLNVELLLPETSDITIKLQGTSPSAGRVVESLTITAGEKTAETANQYLSLSSIKKPITLGDVLVKDTDDTEVSRQLNYLKQTVYQTVSIARYTQYVEVLFKPHPPSLDQPESDFPEDFANTVLLKAAQLQKDVEDLDPARVAQLADGTMATAIRNQRQSVESPINWQHGFYSVTRGRYGHL